MNGAGWRRHELTATTPAGAASVRVRASMIDGVFNEIGMQTAFVDDFSLTFVPELPAGLLKIVLVLPWRPLRARYDA